MFVDICEKQGFIFAVMLCPLIFLCVQDTDTSHVVELKGTKSFKCLGKFGAVIFVLISWVGQKLISIITLSLPNLYQNDV